MTADQSQVSQLLAAAVAALDGTPREGQQQMTQAVADAIDSGEHLLVQAGTGTGKSLAYLVPAIAHAVANNTPVVISTATLALQAQIVTRDLPRVAAALAPLLGREPTWQLVKGRSNYVCQQRLSGGYPEDQDSLFDAAGSATMVASPTSWLGKQVVRLREWAESTDTGDRDDLVPGVSEPAWRQVSVTARECMGASCAMARECFSEQARARAAEVDIVVTNHAMVAIDTFEDRALLPEHDVLVLDEAHEIADRVTSVISQELSVTAIEIAARRARAVGVATADLDKAATALGEAMAPVEPGRLLAYPEGLATALAGVRDAARNVASALRAEPTGGDGARQVARAAVGEVFDVAERLAGRAGHRDDPDVAWLTRSQRPDGTIREGLHVAPVSVAGLLGAGLFSERTVVCTSATLTVGGSFDATAAGIGLTQPDAPRWRGLDVGSPFHYGQQAILYIARHLPAPGRDGMSEQAAAELAELIQAAGGRTLGLFSSRRAAEAATEAMRERLDFPIACQGEDVTGTLVRNFLTEPASCLFGTLSLWQGVDVPGSACQLVVIDRIPFPRPDDPLTSARQDAVARARGNPFMAVAASQAALLLAQGTGRLIRTATDRGVVAVLDSRLATARYAGFLLASLPPMWVTHDKTAALAALRRIDEQALQVCDVTAAEVPQDAPAIK